MFFTNRGSSRVRPSTRSLRRSPPSRRTVGRSQNAYSVQSRHPRPVGARPEEGPAPQVVRAEQEDQRHLLRVREERDVPELHRLQDCRPGGGVLQVRQRRETGPAVQTARTPRPVEIRKPDDHLHVRAPGPEHGRRQKSGDRPAPDAEYRAGQKRRRSLLPVEPRLRGRRSFRQPRAEHEVSEQTHLGEMQVAHSARTSRRSARRVPELGRQRSRIVATRPGRFLGLDGRRRDAQFVVNVDTGQYRFENVAVRIIVPTEATEFIGAQKQIGNFLLVLPSLIKYLNMTLKVGCVKMFVQYVGPLKWLPLGTTTGAAAARNTNTVCAADCCTQL